MPRRFGAGYGTKLFYHNSGHAQNPSSGPSWLYENAPTRIESGAITENAYNPEAIEYEFHLWIA